ncbi:unnamed protein product [Rhizopus stolonifer]
MFLIDIHMMNNQTIQPNMDSKELTIKFIPHLGSSNPSFLFDVIDCSLMTGQSIKLGRYSDRKIISNRLSFKSKVVSRYHAEIWLENEKVYIRDSHSSSGTFVNHSRLGESSQELVDGDLVQLGVDYKGGLESMYRAVKMRLEINRHREDSQFAVNSFLKITNRIQDCCICLYCIAPLQALFIAPCSHIYHYRCLKPLLDQNYPGFACPICRTYSNLEDSVAVEEEEVLQMFGNGHSRERTMMDEDSPESSVSFSGQRLEEEVLSTTLVDPIPTFMQSERI